MSKSVIIIGGGIIGLCTAYYLQKDGHKVTVIDKSDFSSGASYINAGYITPSHIIPLAAPGMINKGIKWMFNSSSPFYVKPRLNYDFLKWSLDFKKSATAKKVEKAIPIIKDINLLSRELYQEMKNSNEFDFFHQHKGLLMYYQTDKAGEEEWKTGQRAIIEGLKVENLTKEEVQKIERNVDLNIKGAVYYHSDAHMTPNNFMHQLKNYLLQNGVDIIANEEVLDVDISVGKIKAVKTNKQKIIADEFVLATGSWSQEFGKKVNLKIPIQAGKGYSIMLPKPVVMPKMPSILVEGSIATTPMVHGLRFAGTMEIAGTQLYINQRRVDGIIKAVKDFMPQFKEQNFSDIKEWAGLRPCTPDGLPYIGRTQKYSNLLVGTGHAMLGWTLGPITGHLLTQEILGDQPDYSSQLLEVERYA